MVVDVVGYLIANPHMMQPVAMLFAFLFALIASK